MSSRSFGLVREGSAATLAELEALRSQVHILLQQNEGLENELRRLTDELDTATKSIIQRGHLYKWRDREISYASKWGLRYFVLQGSTLSYYGDEKDQRPRRTFDLSRCIVRDEGTKKGGMYHVFSIYLVKAGVLDVNSDVSLLVRLSTESRAEAMQWMNMLEQACTLSDYEAIKDGAMSYGALDSLIPADNDGGDNASKVASPGPSPRSGEHTYGTDDSNAGTNDGLQELQEDWSNTQLEEVVMEASDLSPVFLKRVKSSNAMLKKCHSRQTMARNILRRRYPADFSASGNRLAQLPDLVGSGRTHRTRERSADVDPGAGAKFTIPKSFPGSKPMHLKSAPSPLSSDVRPGEQNYRGFFNLSVIILLLANARLFIDSHSKYGFMPSWRVIDGTAAPPSQWAFSKPGLSILSWAASILVSHFLEKLAVRGAISETGMLVANFAAGILNIVLPIAWVWRSQAHPGACMVYLFQSVILWMKLISYAHANRDLRTVWRAENKAKKDAAAASSADPNGSIATPAIDDNAKPVESLFGDVKDMRPPFLQYPHNITLYNLLYFCVAPTLCYQLNYPRSPRIRWRYAFSILVRLFIVGGLIVFSVEQYIKPTLENAILPMEVRDHQGQPAASTQLRGVLPSPPPR